MAGVRVTEETSETESTCERRRTRLKIVTTGQCLTPRDTVRRLAVTDLTLSYTAHQDQQQQQHHYHYQQQQPRDKTNVDIGLAY